MKSSYALRHYGFLLQALIRIAEPLYCVEFGILEGYSTIIIGHTLKEMGRGHLYAYDLFEDYPYSGAVFDKVVKLIDRHELNDVITLRKKNLFDAAEDFDDVSIDFMHIDISNTGDIIRRSIEQFDRKIKPGKIVLFEGGSPLRDKIRWIGDYKKEKLCPEIESNKILREKYTVAVLHPYPSMLICSKNLLVSEQALTAFGYDIYKSNTLCEQISEKELLRDLFGR